MNEDRLMAFAQPMAEIANRNATDEQYGFAAKLICRSSCERAPITVPIRADEIVKPCQKEFRLNRTCMLFFYS